MTQSQALDILKTGANVFLTGEPGSGKTHVTNDYVRYLKSAGIKVAITASTGIAATHLGGMTIHSWSGIGIKKTLSKYDVDRIATTQRISQRISQTSVLVIDEVSMLDADILTSVDAVCREVKDENLPFGGLQVILVGDFFQLPPVTRDNTPAQFAYESPAWGNLQALVCYLTEQHRQEDATFLDILQVLRRNKVGTSHRDHLDARALTPNATHEKDMTRLFSHNADVDAINEQKLQQLEGSATAFQMKTTGKKHLVEQLQRGCLSPERLAVKVGARVMFTKNSPKHDFVNGTLGQVVGFDSSNRCPIVKTDSGRVIHTEPMEWMIEDNGRVLARIAQIPLRLAWAMTVHKSQGMSLDAAIIDLQHAFEPGQGYVALSRVRTLTGLFLVGYNEQALLVHPEVLEHDTTFRELSDEAASAFTKIPKTDIKKLHYNFIRACGGTIPKKNAGTSESPVTTFSVSELRKDHPNAYKRWDDGEDAVLTKQFDKNASVLTIAKALGRQPGAITARLYKLGLIDEKEFQKSK